MVSGKEKKINPNGVYFLWPFLIRAALALMLTSCGGSTGSADGGSKGYTVGGTASGLTGSVVLQDNNGDNLAVLANGRFTFASNIASGSTYNVTVLNRQVGQRCNVDSGTGTIAATNITNVAVNCVTDNTPYTIGGTLMGLATGNSITVANNNANNIKLAADGAFTFPGTQLTGSGYNLSIVNLPSNQPCTYTYGTGTVNATNISGLSVICGLLPNGGMAPAANSATARYQHTATLLLNGKVLVAGGANLSAYWIASAELYDPISDLWSVTGSLTTARTYHTATLLPNGKVLVVGGLGVAGYTASAELYDPSTGAWTTTGNLATARGYHTATLLPNGKVLVTGGFNSTLAPSILSNAELYDPATGAWTTTGNLGTGRVYHTATMLPNGKVLVAGGMNIIGLSSAELYNPDSGSWTYAKGLNEIRLVHTATLLPNGKVLVAGGKFIAQSKTAELYDPASDTWMPTGSLATDRDNHTATLLPTGKVLVTGGESAAGWLTSAELYDPSSGTWVATGSLVTPRTLHTATLLPNGKALVAGGYDISTLNPLTSAELYW